MTLQEKDSNKHKCKTSKKPSDASTNIKLHLNTFGLKA